MTEIKLHFTSSSSHGLLVNLLGQGGKACVIHIGASHPPTKRLNRDRLDMTGDTSLGRNYLITSLIRSPYMRRHQDIPCRPMNLALELGHRLDPCPAWRSPSGSRQVAPPLLRPSRYGSIAFAYNMVYHSKAHGQGGHEQNNYFVEQTTPSAPYPWFATFTYLSFRPNNEAYVNSHF